MKSLLAHGHQISIATTMFISLLVITVASYAGDFGVLVSPLFLTNPYDFIRTKPGRYLEYFLSRTSSISLCRLQTLRIFYFLLDHKILLGFFLSFVTVAANHNSWSWPFLRLQMQDRLVLTVISDFHQLNLPRTPLNGVFQVCWLTLGQTRPILMSW